MYTTGLEYLIKCAQEQAQEKDAALSQRLTAGLAGLGLLVAGAGAGAKAIKPAATNRAGQAMNIIKKPVQSPLAREAKLQKILNAR